jgi:hypothetical protein
VCQAQLNTWRSIGDEPIPITQLSRQANSVTTLERVLAQGEEPAAELEALQRLLERELREPIMLRAAQGGRAGANRIYESLASGVLTPAALSGNGPFGAGLSGWLAETRVSVWSAAARLKAAAHLRLATRVVEVSRLPLEQQAAAIADIESAAKREGGLPLLVYFRFYPSLTKMTAAHLRSQAHLRCAVVAVAAERYRLRHQRWPEALGDLVQRGLLKDVPTDPFDGRPLRWRLLGDGAVIYSVGDDGADDGGLFDRATPAAPGTDRGVRLWHVDVRRQAP